jgi:hypothetical protein
LQLKIPTLTASQASLQHIDVGSLNVGPLAVASLTIANTNFAMNAKEAILRQLSVTLGLNIDANWSIDLEVYSDSGTEHLLNLEFTIPLPDLTIAPLNNIAINIPTLTATNVTVKAKPMVLAVNNATATHVGATNTTLPTAGFSIAGLTLNSVDGSAVTVPAANLDSASVDRVQADPINLAEVGLTDLNVQAAESPLITNTAPLVMPLALGPLPSIPIIDLGFLSVDLVITPEVITHVGHLEITDVKATATVGEMTLQNVTVPFDVFNLTLAHIGINTVAIPTFTAS